MPEPTHGRETGKPQFRQGVEANARRAFRAVQDTQSVACIYHHAAVSQVRSATKKGHVSMGQDFSGTRNEIREKAVEMMLDALISIYA